MEINVMKKPGSILVVDDSSAVRQLLCTCLRKDYTQDGQVVFQDVCTKEVAAAPAGNQAQQ